MNKLSEIHVSSAPLAAGISGLKGRAGTFARARPALAGIAILCLLVWFYWLVMASDIYESEAHVVIQHTDTFVAPEFDVTSLISGGGNQTSRGDLLLVRDYLQSVEVSKALNQKLGLRTHFSDITRDPFSRMWGANSSAEDFHDYLLGRISIELDEYNGVLVITSGAYSPDMARKMTRTLVEMGEQFMNRLAHDLAKEDVSFLENEVRRTNQEASLGRQKVIEFQNKNGIISPEASTQSALTIVARLEQQLTELTIRRTALQSYLVPSNPSVVEIDQQIEAVKKQLAEEQGRLANPKGNSLNRTLEQFQRLEAQAVFAEKLYQGSLAALEKGQIEASRKIKKLAVIQQANLPEEATRPRRIYNALLFTIVIAMLIGVAAMVVEIIRDHKD